MEEIDVQVSESDALQKWYRCDYPVVSFVRTDGGFSVPYAYFNVKCSPLFEGYHFVDLYKTADYLIFSPQKCDTGKSHPLKFGKTGFRRITTNFFKSMNLCGKTYKLYRCKQGFAIKLNEPLHIK